MVLSDAKKRDFMKKLLMSRMRILCKYGFYGLLLMHMIFALDVKTKTVATDGQRIFFNPEFLDSISDSELDYILMHEILHVALEHISKEEDMDDDAYDEACESVVNSIILQSVGGDEEKIQVKEYGGSEHVAPSGKEARNHSLKEIYEMIMNEEDGCDETMDDQSRQEQKQSERRRKQKKESKSQEKWDDHTRWDSRTHDDFERDVWEKNVLDATEAMQTRGMYGGFGSGSIPAFAKRMINELKKPQTDWHTILNNFVQEEITDYSFTPPDRRFSDGDFFLPDFNEKEDKVKDILFMIDTSGSMSEDMITSAYSEIKGAIDQFNGKLEGWLGFFDAAVVAPKPFADEDEFKLIQAEGGGGTSFTVIFEYVDKHMMDNPPASIIILTDGYAPFPEESQSKGIPVLWLLNNTNVEPPWGKVTRITT